VKKARFHDAARLEFLDSVSYYETVQPGLGERFRLSILAAVKLACAMPFAGSPYKYGTRRVFPKKFPFSVVYFAGDDEIIIFAISHFKRKPGYWRSRQADNPLVMPSIDDPTV